MFTISDAAFEKIVTDTMDAIPEKYYRNIHNVAFVVEAQPNTDQRTKLKLSGNQSLYGLYEGVPLTRRASNYNMVLPDKITIFKLPIQLSANSLEELTERVQQTVWHEVAHYFGLDHDQIHELEQK